MKKRICLWAVPLSMMLILSACSAGSTAMTTAANDAYEQVPISAGSETAAETTAADADSKGSAAVINPGDTANSGKKIIYTVDISLEAEDTAAAIDLIGQSAAALGGYISDSSYSRTDSIASGFITVRIPPENLQEFSGKVGTFGTILSSAMGSQDVTAQYIDIASRLTNAEAQEKQLLAIMEKAVEIKDILSVRTELDTVQQEIEELKGQIRLMDNQVGYSTVTIRITEPAPPPETPKADANSGLIAGWSANYIWKGIQKAFSNSISVITIVFGSLLMFISALLIPGLIIAAIIFIILLLVKWSRKRKNAKKPSNN